MNSSGRTFILGTRGSKLALRQTDLALEALRAAFPAATFEVAEIKTLGDRRQDISLKDAGGKGLFVRDIEEALLAEDIDIAVHSAKDMSAQVTPGTLVGGYLPRGAVEDVLVVRDGEPRLGELATGARVGTSSLRRAAQLLLARPDLEVLDIRGNVDTRLRKLADGDYDAVVLAAAGLDRLGVTGLNARPLSLEEMLPAPGQGAIALQCRAADAPTRRILEAVNDPATESAVTAERSLMEALEAGCRMPLGAYAYVSEGRLSLQAGIWTELGVTLARLSAEGDPSDPARLGGELAGRLLEAQSGPPAPVYIVGAGPGDPALITVRGRDALRQADAVVYDRLVDPRLLDEAPPGAERIYAGKDPAGASTSQEAINSLLISLARSGKRVVRLKGGDPFVFGRGGEEVEALAQAGIPAVVVPGITSAIGGLAAAGIPVTHRAVSTGFCVVTGSEDPSKPDSGVDWQALARATDTIVVLMGARGVEGIARALMDGGRAAPTPAAVIEWASTWRQRSVFADLGTIAQRAKVDEISPPALFVVGDVVALSAQLFPNDIRPLAGKRVLVTRTREQASALSELLREAGALPVEQPSLRLVKVESPELVHEGVDGLAEGRFAWTVFTSANGVSAWFDELALRNLDARVFATTRICCIGPGTAAALAERGLRADLVPEQYVAEDVARALDVAGVAGEAILIPRAEGARTLLPERLTELGCAVVEVPLYRAEPAELEVAVLDLLRAGRVDIATFASSSSFSNLLEMLGPEHELLRPVLLASIGPITSATIREAGFEPAVEAAVHTIPGLVAALAASERVR
jgi:uroporphyrinogen III methyltransferase/synthase